MPDETLLSFEQLLERAEIAAQLRSLADGLDNGDSFTLTAGDQVATITPPNRPEFELEVEREHDEDADEGDESGEISIEVEIEWDEADVDTDGTVDAETSADATIEGDVGIDSLDETERTSTEDHTELVEGEADEDTAIVAPIEPEPEAVPAAVTGDDETAESLGQFQLYVDRGGKWRWRLVHRNGNIIATSGQGYASRQKAEQGMASVMRNAPDAQAIAVE